MLVTQVRLHDAIVPSYGDVERKTGVFGWYGSSLSSSSLRSFAPTPRPPMYRSQYSDPRSSVSISCVSRSTWSMRRFNSTLPPRPQEGRKAGCLDNRCPPLLRHPFILRTLRRGVRITVRLMGPYKRAAGGTDEAGPA